jgi:hypothetical protein
MTADGTVTESARSAPPPPDPADEDLARMLVLMWSLASGRRLDRGTRPDKLSPQELIDFWADDFTPVSGRHARACARAEAAA